MKQSQSLLQKHRIEGKLPALRFYSAQHIGGTRQEKSIQLSLGKGLDGILNELHDNFWHDVREVNERYVNTQAITNAVERHRHSVIYFFDDSRIDLQFKAVSTVRWLAEDFDFIAVSKPSEAVKREFMIENLPAIRGAFAPAEDEEADADQIKQFQYGGKVDFDDIIFNLLGLTGKAKHYDKRQREILAERLAEKPTKPKKKAARKKTRNEEEL